MSLLTDNGATVAAAVEYLPFAAAIPVVSAAAFLLDGVFVGAVASRFMLLSAIVSAAVFFGLLFTLREDWGNYALCLNEPIKLVKKESVKENANPFVSTDVPLVFKAKGRKIPSWGIDKYGLCAPLPDATAAQSSGKYDIELIPMGAARLRISAFPQGK